MPYFAPDPTVKDRLLSAFQQLEIWCRVQVAVLLAWRLTRALLMITTKQGPLIERSSAAGKRLIIPAAFYQADKDVFQRLTAPPRPALQTGVAGGHRAVRTF
jgi:hypothetical protein